MKANHRSSMFWAAGLLLALGAVFLLIRFADLGADPPKGLTRSKALYTDEGNYTRNAAAKYLTGRFLMEGDNNSIFILPVLHLLALLSFKVFGMSLASARGPSALFALLAAAAITLYIWKRVNRRSALTALAFLSMNFLYFGSSRLAFHEVTLGFWMVAAVIFLCESDRSALWLVASAVACWVALLTKTSAVFLLPLTLAMIVYDAVRARRAVAQASPPAAPPAMDRRAGFVKKTALFGGCVFVLLAAYYALAIGPNLIEAKHYFSISLGPRFSLAPGRYFVRLAEIIAGPSLWKVGIGTGLWYFASLLCAAWFIASRRLRHNRVAVAAAGWILSYLLLLAVQGYAPSRYYVPLIPAAAILSGIGLDELLRREFTSSARRTAARVAAGVIVVIISLNGFSVARHMLFEREHSFAAMARDVGERMNRDAAAPVLLGDISCSVGLEARVLAVDDIHARLPVRALIALHHPTHYIVVGDLQSLSAATQEALKDTYQNVSVVACYDVLSNYRGRPVRLYRLIPKS